MARAAVPFSLASLADDVLVDAHVVARALGISARQVSRLEGLPVVEVSRRVKRYPISGLRSWIAARTSRGQAE